MFSLLSLLDDIASTFDDISVMTKVALQKTTPLMTDDLAVNSAVITGVHPNRELAMIKAIFWGSLLNKVYCIIAVLALTAIYPAIISIILVVGGLYLAYEGAHKVAEKLFFHAKHSGGASKKNMSEKQKVKGAIRTDLILSIEIIVIAQSSLSGALLTQALTLSVVGVLASIIIYGLVAVLVKIDDMGLYLINKDYKKFGYVLVRMMPYLMKGLGIIGTIAMFLVAGGIFSHAFHFPIYIYEHLQNLVLGMMAGNLVLVALFIIKKVVKK